MRRSPASPLRTAALRLGVPLAVAAAVALALQEAPASTAPAPCASAAIAIVLPPAQGTATQSVAFLSVRNRGSTCRLVTTGSLTVTRNGARVSSIRGNPVSYRINQTIAHGTTMLFDSWWGNWCAPRRGTFRARGVLGTQTGRARYPVLPVCLQAGYHSSVRGVRSPNPAP